MEDLHCKNSLTEIELLAPAKNAEIAITAIDHGADAVYMGASAHGARRQAANSLDDIRTVTEYAHRFNVRVYVTVNTIVYDNEIADVKRLVWKLYAIGVDAIIVQDMGLLRMELPPIALHASTQCDIRTPEKARFLQDAGFSQLVLPRELTLDEIRRFREAVDVPLEAFVHGALCVSYSGDCQASYVTAGRSANRGECAQICRYKFDLEDADGNKLVVGKHLLSLKDMNRLDALADMLDAGVTSFKIEGRLKDAEYVKNVVAAYSSALDRIVADSGGRYKRASRGRVELAFRPDPSKSFNRGFTSYFLHAERPEGALASIESPKWTGERVGTVVRACGSRKLKMKLERSLENGDGLGYFDANGEFTGFRLNRVDGDVLMAASDIAPAAGTVIYRNFDKKWNDGLQQRTSVRIIDVDMSLRISGSMLELKISDKDGVSATVACPVELQEARSPQYDARKRTLSKLGDTEFRLHDLVDSAESVFVPASVLSTLKREGVEMLRAVYTATYSYPVRRRVTGIPRFPYAEITRHDNIANTLAADFYESCGAGCSDKLPRAVEVADAVGGELRVMQTRYCIRRQLGACLRESGARKLPSPLYITSGSTRFRLEFDCRMCRMNVFSDAGRNRGMR